VSAFIVSAASYRLRRRNLFQLGTFFSVAVVAFAGGAILYDSSNILRYYPVDRYAAAALALFSSVALLFWYVLRLFISSRD
jgi:hypothetical protein